MENILTNLFELVRILWDLLSGVWLLVVPMLPLVAWIGFWLFAVNWVKLRGVILAGGWVGVVLIGLVMILVWGVVAPPQGGVHSLFGLTVSNFVGKGVYVTLLFFIMFLCGAVQLSGALGDWCRFDEETPEPAHEHADAHGHH